MKLKNKVVIITGAARGIGYSTAERFAEEGASIILADQDLQELQKATKQIEKNTLSLPKQEFFPVQVDVQSQESIHQLVQKSVDRFQSIDVLVNNAGIVRDAQLIKMQESDFDSVININLKGVYNCTQAIAKLMVEQGQGVILSTASIVGIYGNFGQTNYAASKAGVIAMTKVWARELGPKGIRVNAVAPGFIHTRMTEGIPDKVIEKLLAQIPIRRFGDPCDVANAFVWLASDDAAYVHGHILSVDGGAVV